MSTELLQQIAEEWTEKKFTDKAIQMYGRDLLHLEGLGIAIAEWAEWWGPKIMLLAFAALQDANYHDAAELMLDLANAYEEGGFTHVSMAVKRLRKILKVVLEDDE